MGGRRGRGFPRARDRRIDWSPKSDRVAKSNRDGDALEEEEMEHGQRHRPATALNGISLRSGGATRWRGSHPQLWNPVRPA